MTSSADSDAARRSTLSDVDRGKPQVLAQWIRRTGTAALLVLVLVAASGWLGVRSAQVQATGSSITLTVDYAMVARPGLDTPLRITVDSDRPFGDKITLAVSRDYLAMFETQGFHPEPSDTTALGEDVLLTFDAPPSGSLVVDYDAYIQPADQTGSDGRISVMNGTDRLVTVNFHTALIP